MDLRGAKNQSRPRATEVSPDQPSNSSIAGTRFSKADLENRKRSDRIGEKQLEGDVIKIAKNLLAISLENLQVEPLRIQR